MLYCRRKISYQEMKVSGLQEITQSVIEAVDNASNGIMKIYNSNVVHVKDKNDGSPVTEADKESHRILVSALEFIDKNIPILSEEGDKQKDNNDLFWLIDPLDGTKEFINRNGEFTVNVALIENGNPILGVVSAPALKEKYVGYSDHAYKLSSKGRVDISTRRQSLNACCITLSKSHKSETDQVFIDICKEKFDSIVEIPTGSSLKLCRVAEGMADIYTRLGPTYQWDIAAGQAVVQAAGGVVNDLKGSNLRYEFVSETKNPMFFCAGDPMFKWLDVFNRLV